NARSKRYELPSGERVEEIEASCGPCQPPQLTSGSNATAGAALLKRRSLPPIRNPPRNFHFFGNYGPAGIYRLSAGGQEKLPGTQQFSKVIRCTNWVEVGVIRHQLCECWVTAKCFGE